MADREILMMRLAESLQKFNDDDLVTVFSMVPWARESIHTYISSHQVDMEKQVLAHMEALLTAST